MTVTDIALREDVQTVEQVVRHMAGLAERVDAGDYDDELDTAHEWVRTAEALLKVRDAAVEARIEAARLEAVILRRLGLLHRTDCLPKQVDKANAKWLGGLDASEFAEFLAWIVRPLAVSTLRGSWLFEQRPKERERRAIEGRVERGCRNVVEEYRPSRYDAIPETAAALVGNLIEKGLPFTTQEAAERLAAELGVDMGDEVLARGLVDLTGRAIRSAATLTLDPVVLCVDGSEVQVPAVVTYHDGDSWVRVPWQSASAEQLAAMADDRRAQARAMADAADDLESLAKSVEQWSSPTDAGAADTCRRVHYGHASEQLALSAREDFIRRELRPSGATRRTA